MSFFGNPLTTPVGQKIDLATDGMLASENWALNMEICDIINETDEGPRDAVKALRKKLSTSGKNYKSIMYSLTVLETCVKNCGRRFHGFVATKDFMQELIKIIGPKNDPPQVVQEKVLSLIQTWADAFRGVHELKEVDKVYNDLKSKGIEFPMTDLDSLAPIHTPARPAPQPQAHVRPTTAPVQPQQYVTSGPVTLTPEQQAKLRSELDIVQGNCRVFGEMLTEMVPGQEDVADLELLQELNRTCRQMQQRVVELLDKVANEEVTGELLRINDDLNNVFLRYDRFERYRSGQVTASAQSAVEAPAVSTLPPSYEMAAGMTVPQPSPAPPAVNQPTTANLIDLGDDSSKASTNASDIHVRLAGMSVAEGTATQTPGQNNSTQSTNPTSDDFDMFAQSRQSFDQSKQALGGTTSSYANQLPDQYRGSLGAAVNAKNTGNPAYGQKLPDRVSDMEEMEKWLKENQEAQGANQETMTSTEFDRFLSSRAAAVDQLPNIPTQNTTTSSSSSPHQLGARTNPRGGRQLQKDDTENALFAL